MATDALAAWDALNEDTIGDDDDVVLNLTTIDENAAFQPWPKGDYPAVVDDCEYKVFQSGNKGWKFTLKVTNPETGATKKMFFNNVLTENTRGMFKRTILALAPDLDQEAISLKRTPADLINRECRARVEIGSYNNERRNEVKSLLPPASDGEDFVL